MNTNNFSAFRRTPQQLKEQQRIIDECCSLFYPVMCSIYNAASAVMTDSITLLRHRPEFRHNVKHHAMAAQKAYDKIESKIRLTLADRYQLWLDISDEVYEELRPIINNMRVSCARYLRYKHVTDYDFKAALQVAVTINDIAVAVFSRLMKTFQDKVGFDISSFFIGGSFRDVAHHWGLAVAPFLNTGDDTIVNLNKSVSFSRAAKNFMTTVTDYSLYNRSSDRALRLNPDMWHYLSEADRNTLQQGRSLCPSSDDEVNNDNSHIV